MARLNKCSVPADLVDLVQEAREPCYWFSQRRCRKGNKCPLRHGDQDKFRLPHTSRWTDADGNDQITLRPPLKAAFDAFFKQKGKPVTVSQGKEHTHDGKTFMTYNLINMTPPDEVAIEAALLTGSVTTAANTQGSVKMKGASSKPLPKFGGHGTSVEAALSILIDGAVRPSPGIAGSGVYCFGADSEEQLMDIWKRTATGSYNRGAMFFFGLRGIMVTRQPETEPVPAGAVAWNKDQLAASPESIQYMTVTFSYNALVSQLGQELDQLGYTAKLHTALQAVQKYLAGQSSGDAVPSTQMALFDLCGCPAVGPSVLTGGTSKCGT